MQQKLGDIVPLLKITILFQLAMGTLQIARGEASGSRRALEVPPYRASGPSLPEEELAEYFDLGPEETLTQCEAVFSPEGTFFNTPYQATSRATSPLRPISLSEAIGISQLLKPIIHTDWFGRLMISALRSSYEKIFHPRNPATNSEIWELFKDFSVTEIGNPSLIVFRMLMVKRVADVLLAGVKKLDRIKNPVQRMRIRKGYTELESSAFKEWVDQINQDTSGDPDFKEKLKAFLWLQLEILSKEELERSGEIVLSIDEISHIRWKMFYADILSTTVQEALGNSNELLSKKQGPAPISKKLEEVSEKEPVDSAVSANVKKGIWMTRIPFLRQEGIKILETNPSRESSLRLLKMLASYQRKYLRSGATADFMEQKRRAILGADPLYRKILNAISLEHLKYFSDEELVELGLEYPAIEAFFEVESEKSLKRIVDIYRLTFEKNRRDKKTNQVLYSSLIFGANEVDAQVLSRLVKLQIKPQGEVLSPSENTSLNEVSQFSETALIDAVRVGHTQIAELILKDPRFTALNEVDEWGRTALHFAAESGHTQIAELILKDPRFTAVNQVNKYGQTALHSAAGRGHVQIVELLLQDLRFTALNEGNRYGDTALHVAAWYGYTQIVELLLKDPRFTALNLVNKEGITALHLAARYGHAQIVERLLKDPRFTALNLVDSYGHTALHSAARFGHTQVVELLLKDPRITALNLVDSYGDTALHVAAGRGHVQIVERLLKDPRFTALNLVNKEGQTALHFAAESGHTQIVEQLLKDPRFTAVNQVNKYGQTALHSAARFGHTQVVELLLKDPRFTAVNQVDRWGQTDLHVAADRGHVQIVERLLKDLRFTALNQVNEEGETALHFAAESGHTQIVERLLKDPRFTAVNEVNHDGYTALHLAARKGHTQIVERLLKNLRFTAVNQVDRWGRTALHVAAIYGHTQIVELLLKDPRFTALNEVDIDGYTALHDAAGRGHKQIVRLIKNKIAER